MSAAIGAQKPLVVVEGSLDFVQGGSSLSTSAAIALRFLVHNASAVVRCCFKAALLTSSGSMAQIGLLWMENMDELGTMDSHFIER